MTKKRIALSLCILLFAFASVNLLFSLLYRIDNKYTSAAPRGRGGNIEITAAALENNDVVPLIDGWEYYPGQLYTPEELHNSTAQYTEIFIGQFGNFSADTPDGSPYGRATYRLTVHTDPSLPSLAVELPEIFSAARIWINGEQASVNGGLSPAPYSPYIRTRYLSVPSGTAELVIQTENHTHYYSGITYPPLLGTQEGIADVLVCRALFYGLLCFFSLGAAAVSHFLWFSRRRSLYLAFGLLTICFALRVCYPFLHWLGVGVRLPYILEDSAYFAILVCMAVITRYTCAVPARLHRIVLIVTGAFCLAPAVAQLLVFPLWPQAVTVYGLLISACKAAVSLYLLVASAIGCIRSNASPWLLAGNAVFAAGLLTDLLTGGLFEPIRFGWQDEYSSFIMVLLFCGLMASRGRHMLRENERLTDHLQQEVAIKTRHLTGLLEERKRFLSSVAHDLKAPVAVIRTYTGYIRQENIAVDDELREYLDLIDRKSGQLESSLSDLQLFNLESRAGDEPTPAELHDFLKDLYRETLPYTDANGIYYYLDLPREPAHIFCQRRRLFRALENILLNATAYTPPGGRITLSLLCERDWAVIRVADTGAGISPENLPHIFDYRFSTNNQPPDSGSRGLGLYFARITAEELGGTLTVVSEPGLGTTFSMRLPLQHPSPKTEEL